MSSRREQNQSRGISNPAKLFLEFQGSEGYFKYYDKSTKQNVQADNPKFLLITERITITGWNRTNGGLYSNEISDIMSEELDVKYHKANNKNIVKGLYADIKDKIGAKNVNGKYTKVVYCMLYINKEWKMCCIKMTGKQITSWINVLQQVKDAGLNEFDVMFKIDKIEFDDSGAIKYYFPTFAFDVLDESNAAQKKIMIAADDNFEVLKSYFEKKKNGETGTSERVAQANNPQPKQSENQEEEEEEPFTDTSNDTVFNQEEEDDDLPW